MKNLKNIGFISLLAFLAAAALAGGIVYYVVQKELIKKKDGDTKENCDETSDKVCTTAVKPVCGVDGKTYSNVCKAGCTKIAHEGACL